jgi:hypothetical protein
VSDMPSTLFFSVDAIDKRVLMNHESIFIVHESSFVSRPAVGVSVRDERTPSNHQFRQLDSNNKLTVDKSPV